VGVTGLLHTIALVCRQKAMHIRNEWQDDASAKNWEDDAEQIVQMAEWI
jgi:hypothetical protein